MTTKKTDLKTAKPIIEVTGEIVPGVMNEMVAYKDEASKQQKLIDNLMAEINMVDTNASICFGTKAQEKVTEISDKMLEGVKNKDLGSSGNALNEMVATIRGFDIDELDPNKKPGFFARLFGKMKPLAKFLQKYE
ncbi:MAG: toxic anion resistance protein, partial [Proteobacteria bacterium]|nr:toxic anion resistance protein [Pseudomonadota bacterium]